MKAHNTWWLGGIAALTLAMAGCDDDNGNGNGNGNGELNGGDAGGTDAGTMAPDGATSPDAGGETIVDVAAGDDRFTVLVQALQRVDLDDALSSNGPFTVFAPTDAAFEQLLNELGVSDLSEIDDETLTLFLQNHVIEGEVTSGEIPTDPPTARTLADLTLWFETNGDVTVNEATVTDPDITASNGVIHAIDAVLVPPDVPTLAEYAGLNSLLAALEDQNLDLSEDSENGPYTVFGPTDEAFAGVLEALGAADLSEVDDDLLQGTLLYHVAGDATVTSDDLEEGPNVVPTLATPSYEDSDTAEQDYMTLLVTKSDDGVTANAANVVVADLVATNGVIHVVDAVITRPTIADMVEIAGLTELAGAVAAAADISEDTSVADALAMVSPLTAFAPTNEAFEAVDVPGDPEQVRNILLYHAVDADAMSSELTAGPLTTLAGEDVTIALQDDQVTVEGNGNDSPASVVIPDVVVDNGVIHVIDQVLLP